MGAVYVVEQISTGVQRALKLMHPQLVADAKLRERFEQEARVGGRIESEHVVQVLAAGVEPVMGAPWIVMELLRGEDLGAFVARVGRVPLDACLAVVEQLCHAMGAAHAAGIVHRDLKPENIFLAKAKRARSQVTVKVLDFGIAKIAAEAKTTATDAIGTPSWMAPEQTARGGAIGPPADVWPLALIVYYMLTGRSYWRSADDDAAPLQVLLREVVLDPMPPASQRAAEAGLAQVLPSGFDGWFGRATDRDPRRRFENASVAYSELIRACACPKAAVSPLAYADTAPAPTAPATKGGGRAEPVPPTQFQPPPALVPPTLPDRAAPARTQPGGGRSASTTGGVEFSAQRVRVKVSWLFGGAGIIVAVAAVAAALVHDSETSSGSAPGAPLVVSPDAPIPAAMPAQSGLGTGDSGPVDLLPLTQPTATIPHARSPSAPAPTHGPASGGCGCAPGDVDCAIRCSVHKH